MREEATGLVFVKARVSSPVEDSPSEELDFLIDTGARLSVVPRKALEKLGLKPHSHMTFTLADGSHIERDVGNVGFEFEGKRGASPVIFGEEKDATVLGVTTLEGLGFYVDPVRRQLKELPLLL